MERPQLAPGYLNSSHRHYLSGFLAGVGKPEHGDASVSGSADATGEGAADRLPVSEEAVSGTTLSWEEETKRKIHPFDAFASLLQCAQANQPPSREDRLRFQWFGLFYQGPKSDAFVVRVRLPEGKLRGFQLIELAEIVQRLAGGAVEMNAQGGLDIPGIPVRAGVEILRCLAEAGLSARGTGGDCVQAVRGGEREEPANSKSPAVSGLVHELEQVLAQSREFGNLPGPCEIAFRLVGADAAAPGDDAPCILLQGAVAPGAGSVQPERWPVEEEAETLTWQMLLPGSGTLGVAFSTGAAVEVCLALLRVWSQHADRTSRERASLPFFCARFGAEQLRGAIEQETGRKFDLRLPADPVAAPVLAPREILLRHRRLLSGQLVALARVIAELGISEARLVQPGALLVPNGVDAAALAEVLGSLI